MILSLRSLAQKLRAGADPVEVADLLEVHAETMDSLERLGGEVDVPEGARKP